MRFEVSKEQLERIKTGYERLRKTREYKKERLKEVFENESIFEDIENVFGKKYIKPTDKFNIQMEIFWPYTEEEPPHWLSYIFHLHQLQRNWRSFNFSDQITSHHYLVGYKLSLDVKPALYNERVWQNRTISNLKQFLNLGFFSPKSYQFADYRIVKIQGPYTQIVQASKSKGKPDIESIKFEEKKPYQDIIALQDIPFVFNYYEQIIEEIKRDMLGRGQTTKVAVDVGEGESITRRNDEKGERFVPRNEDDVAKLILDYLVYKFIPDVNLFEENYPSIVPFDFDPPPSMPYEKATITINEFDKWLRDRGFNTRMRKTRKGGHVILDLMFDRVPENYSPFVRSPKFDTWYLQHGKLGLVYAANADFIKTTALGFAVSKRKKSKANKVLTKITIERDDPGLRLWNIFADWTRSRKDLGIAAKGTIYETGEVVIPVKQLPEKNTAEETVKYTIDPNIHVPSTIEPKYKSKWIWLVGKHPHILVEPGYGKMNKMSLVEEMFEDFGWISSEYTKLGARKFLQRYC